jgi:Ca2+-binding RTX toxin-like protein
LDVVTELAGQGIDAVITTVTAYSLGANVENLAFAGVGNFAGNGNALSNAITGGAGNDTLNGAAGNDPLNGGGAGNDVFVFGPGAGADRVVGFDANREGGQDLLDLSAYGITAQTLDLSVSKTELLSTGDTLLTIGGHTILLEGVALSSLDASDFVLA